MSCDTVHYAAVHSIIDKFLLAPTVVPVCILEDLPLHIEKLATQKSNQALCYKVLLEVELSVSSIWKDDFLTYPQNRILR